PLLRAGRAPGTDPVLRLTTEEVLDLVDRGAGRLARAGIALLLPRSWALAEPVLRVDVATPASSAGGHEFGLDRLVGWNWRVALGGHELTDAELAELAAAKADLVRLRGDWVRVDARTLAAVQRFVHGAPRRRPATFGGLIGELTGEAPPVPVEEVRATGWLGDLLAGGADGRVEEVPAPAALTATLRPYQLRGLSWLAFLDRLGLGAVLADDMGLGKTVQVLALLLHEREREGGGRLAPTLLVCPMSLVGNWAREAARFAPTLRVVVHHGPGRPRGAALAASVAGADLVVTTYGLLVRDLAALRELPWGRLVLDEAHHVKNTGTRQARAVRQVPAARRVALTGTPVENRLEELRGVLDAVVPGLLGSAATFRQRFARPIEQDRDPGAAARLRAVTRPFLLRRVKTDRSIIADLPEKVEMVVPVNLTREQAALYRAAVDDLLARLAEVGAMQRRGLVLAGLTRLKQICNHPAHFLGDGSPLLTRGRHRSGKLAVVEDLVESLLAEGDRALLFTQFVEFGNLLVPYLSDRFGVEVPFLHGGVSRAGRDAMVARFQGGDDVPLLLLSLKAGGSGLNLTAANHVVHLDRWWNPAVEDQATDRAFRIGQRRDVQVRKLVSIGTVEERIDATLAGKAELADLVVGGGEAWITELDTAALRELLALSAEAVGE
ncbi:DEAD/DEAH box helicase, partial [Kineococcus glutinatus]|uniref:DEAD/DEAH box helicase n=1 Tax=Kineococcus glutinatus TaxID=1070872 RepID=UPI0031EA6B8F